MTIEVLLGAADHASHAALTQGSVAPCFPARPARRRDRPIVDALYALVAAHGGRPDDRSFGADAP